jgi:hypothetical protein
MSRTLGYNGDGDVGSDASSIDGNIHARPIERHARRKVRIVSKPDKRDWA